MGKTSAAEWMKSIRKPKTGVRSLNRKGPLDNHPGMVEGEDPPKLGECDPGECDRVEGVGEQQNSLEGAVEACPNTEKTGGVNSLEGAGEDLVCEGGEETPNKSRNTKSPSPR